MPDEKDTKPAPERTATSAPSAPSAPPASSARSTAALAEMVNAANALAAIQQQAAVAAMQLPEKRLDEAGEAGAHTGYYLRDDGDGKTTKVDANGNEV